MKKIALSLLISSAVMTAFAGGPEVPPAPMITPGLYLGFGGSWNTVDVDVNGIGTALLTGTSPTIVAVDQYKQSQNRLAPMAQLGYWGPIDSMWLWGLVAEYKYLNYNTNGGNGGVILPNASSVSPFIWSGASLSTTSLDTVKNELMLLLYFGAQYDKGYFYFGLGPIFWTVSNSINGNGMIASVPGTAVRISNSTGVVHKTIWGGAAQLGYNYYFAPTWFLGANYTYAQSGTYTLTNSQNQGFLSGSVNNGFTVYTTRNFSVTVQEVMVSLNKVFEL